MANLTKEEKRAMCGCLDHQDRCLHQNHYPPTDTVLPILGECRPLSILRV